MGKFLDRKEQVIDAQLTQYGKHLLSKGKLKPVYYSFFDDDVIYDADYASKTEIQNDIEPRIKEIPRVETQYLFIGAETSVLRNNKLIRSGKEEIGSEAVQPTPDRQYALSAPLGNSSVFNDYIPAIHVDYLKGEITGTIDYQQSLRHQTLQIPQLSSSVIYETMMGETEPEPNDESDEIDPIQVDDDVESKVFDDGTFIKVKEDYILLRLEEKNTEFLAENFDIEVYKVEEDRKGNEILTPLSFVKKHKKVKSNLLLDDEEEEILLPEVDPSFVEYFFDVFVDKEIDPDVLCEIKESNKNKNILSDDDIQCPEKTKIKDIYKTSVDDYVDEKEECD